MKHFYNIGGDGNIRCRIDEGIICKDDNYFFSCNGKIHKNEKTILDYVFYKKNKILYKYQLMDDAKREEIKDNVNLCVRKKYIPWTNLNNEEYEIRKANTMNLFTKQFTIINENPFKELLRKIVDKSKRDIVELYVDNNKQHYYIDRKHIFKSNMVLSISGNIMLRGDEVWTPYTNIEDEDKVIFTFAVAPSGNHLLSAKNKNHKLEIYKNHMKKSVHLAMYSMYESAKLLRDKYVYLIWNAFGLGAFISKLNEETKVLVQTIVLKIIIDTFNDFDFSDCTLALVFGNLLEGHKTDYYMKNNNGNILWLYGDMLDIALDFKRSENCEVSVLMASNNNGIGNHFFNLPKGTRGGNASKASEENNIRRSNIIWKVLFINFYDMKLRSGMVKEINNKKNRTDVDRSINQIYERRKVELEIDQQLINYIG